MLVSLKMVADFSRGVQVDRSATYFPRPTPRFLNRLLELRSSSTPPVRVLVGRKYWVSRRFLLSDVGQRMPSA
jgi:hypothetical protein